MQVNYKILSTKIKSQKESKIGRKLQQGSKVDLQTLDFKVKVEHVEQQKLGSKENLQKVKAEHQKIKTRF